MKTPILRLSIGQSIALSGTALDYDGNYVQINRKFDSVETAQVFIDTMRDEQGFEFQLVTMRSHYDKRAA